MPARRRLMAGVLVAVVGPAVFAAGSLPARTHVDGAVVGLLMLIPTVVGAAIGGPVAAVIAVVEGSVLHNLLFTEPYATLRVADSTDVVGLIVHTVVAIAVSLVVVREQQLARVATQRRDQAARVRALEEVDRSRTALLGAVSHNLRTPLAAIAAAASELQATDVAFSGEDRRVLAGTVVEQARRLDRTVSNLLDATRVQSRAVRPAREVMEVEDLLDECVRDLGSVEARRRVRVRVRPGTPLLHVDPPLLVAAVRNLLDNALRHGPAGTPVEVVARGAGDVVVISVRDHGPGLGGVDPETLFVPFRAGTTGGMGLGLSICRGFVEMHGGQVRAREVEDGGAVFEVVLPGIGEPDAEP